MKKEFIGNQIKLLHQVVNWYIKLIHGIISSPHPYSLPLTDADVNFINRKAKLDNKRNEIIKDFYKYIKLYDFSYMVAGESELNRLKDKLKATPEFDIVNLKKSFFKKIIIKRKFKNLMKKIDKYIDKRRKEYFFEDENINWILNGIFREYSKNTLYDGDNVKISLYVDLEYYEGIEILNDIDRYNKILQADM